MKLFNKILGVGEKKEYFISSYSGNYSICVRVGKRIVELKEFNTDDPDYNKLLAEELLETLNTSYD